MKTPTQKRDVDFFNALSRGHLPELLGMRVTEVTARTLTAQMAVEKRHLAPNGFLHAGSVVALADNTAGYACIAQLPPGASFTTVELKCNYLGTARHGMVACTASPLHIGRSTQVWDARVTAGADGTAGAGARGKLIAVFRCTQLVLTGG